MASASKQTERIRKQKRHTKGKRRKAKNRTEGTTPSKAELFGDK